MDYSTPTMMYPYANVRVNIYRILKTRNRIDFFTLPFVPWYIFKYYFLGQGCVDVVRQARHNENDRRIYF